MPRIQAPLPAQIEQQHGALMAADVTLGIILVSELWRLFRERNKRHTFIVRRMLAWHEEGIDIDQAMLSLSTYVGHAMVTNTYWYLTAVPELMALAASKFESRMSPEVCHA